MTDNKRDNRLTIKDWSENDRPREKMAKNGTHTLSDAELLAILIGSGNKDETAVELSKRILFTCNDNINELAKLNINDLCRQFKGIGEAKAITIIAALELGKRRKTKDILERTSVSSSKNLQELFEPILIDLQHEEFWITFLDRANKIIHTQKLTQGGSTQTIVDIPLLLKTSLEKAAQSIAVAHNHPSGSCKPSNEDILITKRIKTGCEAIGIRLLDHIIIGGGNYYSFCDDGNIL